MRKRTRDDYELFYMEVPQSDYLDDIDTTIEDEHQPDSYDDDKGLSDEQVSELAQDSLDAARDRERLEAEQPDAPGDQG